MTQQIHSAFRSGAEILAKANCRYTAVHRAHGISQTEWELLTQEEHWTQDEARQIRSILSSVIEVCMSVIAMPAVPLPGQYAAAVISICVAPANRIIAAFKCPDTFDATAAAGVTEPFEVKPMRPEQIIALVLAYSGGYGGQPAMERLPREVAEMHKMELKDTKDKKQ